MWRIASLLGSIVVVLGSAAFVGSAFLVPEPTERTLTDLTPDVNRGAYVARLAGCVACHTDAKNGGAVLAGGAAIETDFGNFYAPNITPHPEDGIGRWTLADFAKTLTQGESPDGRHYFPSFPYTFYTRLTDQDIVDLWAAVRSVPPVTSRAPAHDLEFPFGFRQVMRVWKAIYFDTDELEPVEGKSDAWNRGRYLARGPAHCGACHTPRNLLGARLAAQRYQGGVGPGAEKIPPITPQALDERGWSREDLVYALRTGIMPDGDVFGGSMVEVVRDATQFWSEDDLAALAEYLMDSEIGG